MRDVFCTIRVGIAHGVDTRYIRKHGLVVRNSQFSIGQLNTRSLSNIGTLFVRDARKKGNALNGLALALGEMNTEEVVLRDRRQPGLLVHLFTVLEALERSYGAVIDRDVV